nr:MAG TPA: hypothetical protein [Caudoviricetes sp.]
MPSNIPGKLSSFYYSQMVVHNFYHTIAHIYSLLFNVYTQQLILQAIVNYFSL